MILTLAILWVTLSAVFFGALAFAAGQPTPNLDLQALLDDPSLREYQVQFVESDDAAYAQFETMPS